MPPQDLHVLIYLQSGYLHRYTLTPSRGIQGLHSSRNCRVAELDESLAGITEFIGCGMGYFQKDRTGIRVFLEERTRAPDKGKDPKCTPTRVKPLGSRSLLIRNHREQNRKRQLRTLHLVLRTRSGRQRPATATGFTHAHEDHDTDFTEKYII